MKLGMIWKILIGALLLFGVEAWAADYSIDNTCKGCSRRYNDSINVYGRRAIRVNQVGYRPQDPKSAFVANPVGTTFRVINVETGVEAASGTLVALGASPHPSMWVNGAFNSITSIYEFGDTTTNGSETLYKADFSDISTAGRYKVVVGTDSSAIFRVEEKVYNYVFESALQFFGSQRCGDTYSWIHGACHLKDGSAINHDLTGGWHDCGDHFKVSATISYAALILALTYTIFPEKAEDFYGRSYNDTLPFGTDGIPDLLWEAKIGADYIFKLYKASKADGLIEKGDMYHSVGVDGVDHAYWDVPERQDAQPPSKGGADRVVATGIGGNYAAAFSATLSLFANGWELFDKPYADSMQAAAVDIYDKIVYPKRLVNTTGLGGFYKGGNSQYDDFPAMAALALLKTTKDHRFYYDLVENKTINNNATNAMYNLPYFAAGYLGSQSGFYPGGWPTDYENVHSFVMYAFAKLVLPTDAKAAEFGISPVVRDSLMKRTVATLRRMASDGSNGSTAIPTKDGYFIHADEPYHGVFTSMGWGYNRYNMGTVNELFMMWDLTGEKEYFNIGLDNLNYNLGMNPWDISFIMGVGDKNLQHPHNRAANPDGYNVGGFPYEYKCPRGALMGGSRPDHTLKDDWSDYTVTETCIDFSAQFVLPAQMLAKDLPPDNLGPTIFNVVATPISNTSALISWETNELAQMTVYISKKVGGTILDTLSSKGLSKTGSVLAEGLEQGVTYYYYLEGQDIRRNLSKEDNHGEWYSFVMVATPATISGVRICQVEDKTAKIYWWTTNGAYNSLVKYGTDPANLDQMAVGDNGQPVMFHETILTGLTPGVKYYFDVMSGTGSDDNGGIHYSFTTPANAVYVNYNVTIKPVNKANPGADFFLEVYNNEAIAYNDLEVRFYFKTKTVAASAVAARLDIREIIDVTGSPTQKPYSITVGTAVAVPNTNQYYLPIKINGELPVAGRAKIEMVLLNGWNPLPWTELDGSWSLIPHIDPADPVNFTGVSIQKAIDGLYTNDQQVQKINGVNEVTFVKDPYISAYFGGNHIFGYPPDYASGNTPIQKRDMFMLFTSPFKSPQTSSEQVTYAADFNGSAWTAPRGNMNLLELNGLDLSPAMIFPNPNNADSFSFAHSVGNLAYGPNREEFVAWHNANANQSNSYDCACVYKRLMVEVDSILTPRPKRLVKTDPADTVKFYQGKRKLVKLTMTDSNSVLITDENTSVSISAKDAGFLFWAGADDTIPVTKITFKDGLAEFYISYSTPIPTGGKVTSTLILKALNGNPDYFYVLDNPVLVVEPTPPWPIIESASMLDTNCDHIPDAIDITLLGSFVPGKYDFSKVRFVFEGDTLTATAKKDIDANHIRIPFKSLSGTVNTSATGLIQMFVNVAGKGEQKSEDTYKDGISPIMLSASIQENLDTAGIVPDSLFVQFSEPVKPNAAWIYDLFAPDGSVQTAPIVKSMNVFNESKNIMVYVIDQPGKLSHSVLEGDSLQLQESAPLQDRNGNGLDACTKAKLRISVKRHPIPLSYSSISDSDGDGLADLVSLKFSGPVNALHQPDSISAAFGYFTTETLTTGKWTWNVDSTKSTLILAAPFKLGNTAGKFQGNVDGKEYINAGQVVQHKGTGADYEADSILAEDLAGPVFTSAMYSQGNLATDSLKVTMSEPTVLRKDSTGKVFLVRERGGEVALSPLGRRISTNGATATFFEGQDSPGYVVEGDRIRFDPSASRFQDVNGNIPGIDNPWVSVSGTGKIKVKVEVVMQHSVTRGGDGAGYSKYPPAEDETFRIALWNPKKGGLDILKNGMVAISGVDTALYHTQGPTFLVTLDIPRGAGFGETPVWDSVQVKLNLLAYTNLGSFVNNVTQALTLRGGEYLDDNNQVHILVEWTAQDGKGPVSKAGRHIGSGPYVGKAVVASQIWCSNSKLDTKVRLRFDHNKSSYSTDWLFGYMRPESKKK